MSGLAFAALLAPSSLTATVTSSSAVTLGWTDPNTAEPGYVVQRSLRPDRGFIRVKILGPDAISYSDSGLAPATTYYYRIVTRSTSRHSDVVSATTLTAGSLPTPTPSATPAPTQTPRPSSTPVPPGDTIPPSVPSGLSGSAPACTQINLSWKPSVDTGGSGLQGYRVFRNGSPSNIYVTKPAVSATDTSVSGSTVYNYSVAALDNAGNQSGNSATLLMNTPPCPTSGGPWAKRFGGTGGEIPHAIAVDSAGNMVVVGEFGMATNFGGGPLSSAGGSDVFVAKYSPSGAYLWAKRLGGASDEGATAVAVDDQGAIFVTGYFRGTSIDLGGGALINAGPVTSSDGFIAKYSATGQHLWSSAFGGSYDGDVADGIAVDPIGDVIAVGVFRGTAVDFGGRALSSTWDGQDTFVVKLSGASGSNVWAKNVNCGGPDMAKGVAVDGSGNVFVIGQFAGNADFGSGSYITTSGFDDVYLAKYSSSGAYLWAKTFGGPNSDIGSAVGVDGGGNVAITGSFQGTVSFGGASLTSHAGGADVFVARYTGSGAHVWSKRFGDSATNYGNGIAADAAGNVVVTGAFYGTIDPGGGPLRSADLSTTDIFVAKYSPSGAYLWSQRYGDTSVDWGRGIAFGPNGAIVTGNFAGSVDFGGTSLASAGAFDGFLLSLGQ